MTVKFVLTTNEPVLIINALKEEMDRRLEMTRREQLSKKRKIDQARCAGEINALEGVKWFLDHIEFKPDSTNHKFLALTLNFWGKAKTEEEALVELRKAGGSVNLEKHGYVMYRVHPDTHCHGVDGAFVYPKGNPPVKLYDRLKGKKVETGV